jgi:hypothetical protein
MEIRGQMVLKRIPGLSPSVPDHCSHYLHMFATGLSKAKSCVDLPASHARPLNCMLPWPKLALHPN